jgi:hypothetical protein
MILIQLIVLLMRLEIFAPMSTPSMELRFQIIVLNLVNFLVFSLKYIKISYFLDKKKVELAFNV